MLIRLLERIPNVAQRAGKHVSEKDVVIKLQGECSVYKPDGEPLCILRRNGLNSLTLERAYPVLYDLRKYTSDNRSKYAGATERQAVRYADGRKGKTPRVLGPDGKILSVASAIVGYFDRQGGRFPYCRETAFVGQHAERWADVTPLVEDVARLFKDTMAPRYEKQMAMAKRTPREFVIGSTPFTTITVNNNVAGAIHTDKGDYKEGFGIISCHRRGHYEGGWLVFPEWGVAADLQDGDVIFFNSHDWHGVTPFVNADAAAWRISVVYYFRSKMVDCKDAAHEVERAQKRYGTIR